MTSDTDSLSTNSALSRRLVIDYLWWALAILLIVGGIWWLGFEAIIYHPTPFYGEWLPVASAAYLLMVGAVISTVAAAAIALSPRADKKWVTTLASAVPLLGILALAVNSFRGGLDPGMLPSLIRHVTAAILGASCIAIFSQVVGQHVRAGSEPSRREAIYILCGITLFSIMFASNIAALRDGMDSIVAPYLRHGHEYVGDIGIGGSILGLFSQYAEVHEHLSMHSKVHPPGPVAMLWFLSYFVGREPAALAWATIAIGSLSIWPLYGLCARMFKNRNIALICAAVFTLIPTIVLFTATSTDIVFMPFTITTLYCFWRAIHESSVRWAVLGGIGYAIMSLTSFSLIAVGAFFGFIGLWRLMNEETAPAVFKTAFVMIAAFLSIHAIVYFLTGFNVVEVFQLSKHQFDMDQANLDEVTPRYPAYMFRVINPFCWIVFAGIPVFVLFIRRMTTKADGGRTIFFMILATLIVLDLLYLARGEGERSAMYIMPFVAIVAAHYLADCSLQLRSIRPVVVTLGFLAVQCWLMEVLLFTYW